MPEKPRIRTLMDSQHVKGFETLHKFASQYFLSYFLVTLKENHLGKLSLVVSQILRLFLNILALDDTYSL